MAGIKHAFTSAIEDGADATLVRPSNWNADHSITGDVDFGTHAITNIGNVDGVDVSAHVVAVPSTTVHYDTSLCRYYLSADQANIPASTNARLELDTELYDLGDNFSVANWYGASGTYLQSDADSDSTHIQDDDAGFANGATVLSEAGSLVRWASNAAGDANVGTGYVTTSAAQTLTIVKATGADFAASYYYWIKKNHYITPTTGYYFISANIRYDPTEDQKRYAISIYKGGISIAAQNVHASGTIPLVLTVVVIAYLTAGDMVMLCSNAVSTASAYTVKGGATEGYATYSSLMIKLLQAG